MRFSFLVPVYNAEKTLQSCVGSLLNQTFLGQYEIILYDDASPDGSGKMCDQLQERNPLRIKCVHGKTNLGSLKVRLELAKHASGEILIFVDSDDLVHPSMLETINNIFEDTKCDLVIYEYWSLYNIRGGFNLKRRISDFEGIKVYSKENKEELYKLYSTGTLNAIWRKAFKKELFSFPYRDEIKNTVSYGEDVLFSLQLLNVSDCAVCIDKPLYYYRYAKNGMVRSKDFRSIQKRIDNAKLFYEQFVNTVLGWRVDITPLYQDIINAIHTYIYFILGLDELLFEDRIKMYEDILSCEVFRNALINVVNANDINKLLLQGQYKQVESAFRRTKILRNLKYFIMDVFIK